MATETYGLRIERTLEAPRKAVFRAWTTPELLEQWMHPHADWTTPVAETDPRVGGAYRYEFRSPEGQVFQEVGHFRKVEPPERLVYTCRFGSPGAIEPFDTEVTVEFHDAGDKTRLVLKHEGYARAEDRDAHEQGWPDFLDRLAELLAARTRA
jgi:uncharacterized protein YndB with AHSA1/START domain